MCRWTTTWHSVQEEALLRLTVANSSPSECLCVPACGVCVCVGVRPDYEKCLLLHSCLYAQAAQQIVGAARSRAGHNEQNDWTDLSEKNPECWRCAATSHQQVFFLWTWQESNLFKLIKPRPLKTPPQKPAASRRGGQQDCRQQPLRWHTQNMATWQTAGSFEWGTERERERGRARVRKKEPMLVLNRANKLGQNKHARARAQN